MHNTQVQEYFQYVEIVLIQFPLLLTSYISKIILFVTINKPILNNTHLTFSYLLVGTPYKDMLYLMYYLVTQ